MFNKEIKVKLKDKGKDKEKEFNIGNVIKYEIFIIKINSIIEEEYNIKIKKTNNLYEIYYFDEDKDTTEIKTEEDFRNFINLDISDLYLEINESLINSIIIKEFKNLKEQNNALKRQNKFLKQKNETFEEMSKIQAEKIKILKSEKENEIEKSKILLKSLEDEQNQKNAIAEQLEGTKKLQESMSFINNSILNFNNKNENENEDKAKDIQLNNLKEENKMLKNQLEEERSKIKIFNTNQEEYYNNKINQSVIAIQKKNEEINEIKNNYENKLNNIREECSKEINQKLSKKYIEKLQPVQESKINIQKTNDNYELNSSRSIMSRISQCSTIHSDIKCNNCGACPIIGYRYKCLECPNYNLCDECEKIVSHEHNFIRYVNQESEEKKYSYECLSSKLCVYAYVKSEKAEISIVIKNNGVAQWTENTKLICHKDNKASFNDIILKPLKSGEFNSVQITFDNINDLAPSTYSSKLLFSVDGKIYGEPLKINLNIIERNK